MDISLRTHLKETVEDVFRDMEYGQGRVDFKTCIFQFAAMGVARLHASSGMIKRQIRKNILREIIGISGGAFRDGKKVSFGN